MYKRQVVAHLLLPVVHGRQLQDDGEVPPGPDGDGHARDVHAQDAGVLLSLIHISLSSLVLRRILETVAKAVSAMAKYIAKPRRMMIAAIDNRLPVSI